MDYNKNDFSIISKNDRQILKDIMPLQKPLSIFIEPTNYCNFRCVQCMHGPENTRNDLKPFVHMDMKLFSKIVDDLIQWKGNKLKLIRLTALGEPFLHPNILDMIKMLKEGQVAERIDLFSNGSLLNEEICNKLVDYGLDSIRFSIYSVLDEKHKKITQSTVEIKKIQENIALLKRIREEKKAKKPYILVKMFDTYSEENDIFINMYKDIADEVGFEKVHNATKYEEYDLVKAYYNDEATEKKVTESYENSLNNHNACPKPFMSLVINSTGKVLICTHDAPKKTKVGDVNDNTLKEIWNGETLFEFRKMHLTGKKSQNELCKNCNWYKLFPLEDNVDGFPIEKLKPNCK